MSHRRICVRTGAAMAALLTCFSSGTAELVQIVHGPRAPTLQQYAAQELARQFERLFDDVQVRVVESPASQSGTTVYVGNPAGNAHVARLFTDWPDLSDQGIVIRSQPEQHVHFVGGGSPVATMWAAYELGYRLGIRYLPRGDIYPREKRRFDLTDLDGVMEPQLRSRTWRTVNDFAIGPESWDVEEHRRFLRQLAKMKFNRVMLAVYPWQPFVRYEFNGVTKTTATHWFDEKYPVDGETVGRKAFGGMKLFENPDFAGLTTSDERHRAGRKHLQALIDSAHELGMTVGVSIVPCEFPLEFQQVLPGSVVAHQLKNLTITAGSDLGPHDSTFRKLVATKIRAYLDTYPQLDRLYVSMSEFPTWGAHADEAMHILHQHGLSTEITLEKLVQLARDRDLIVSGDRGEQAIRGNVVGLAFFHLLFQDPKLLRRADGASVELVIQNVDPALYSVLDQVIPQGAATLNFVDCTARRSARNRSLLQQVPTARVPSELIMTLADDNVGVLPQSAVNSLSMLTDTIRQQGWAGFSTRWWVPGELDPAIYFLARAAWDGQLSGEQAVRELWTTATGNKAAADRLWKAWQHLETATNLIDSHAIGFSFPVPGMLMKHYTADPIPEWWEQAAGEYTDYMIELYRAHGSIDGDATPMLFYYAKRGEYVLEYFAAVKAVRQAAIARKAGDMETALEHLETALEQTYNCINTLSDVAQDQSDRGLIAVLNAYAWRPLLAEYEKLSEAE